MTGTALARRELTEREEASLEKRARMFAGAASTDLVPKPLRGKAADVFLVITMGARWGLEPAESFGYFHVIEGKVQPSVEFRVAIINNAGHQLRPVNLSATDVTVKGRRREERNDPDAWVHFTWTIEDARKAELLDQWVEQWKSSGSGKRYAEKYVVGDDRGIDPERVAKAPEWVKKLVDAGDIKRKDNWWKYPVDMLYARAAGRLCKMLFGDAMLGLPPLDEDLIDDLVSPERDVPSREHPEGEDVVDAELIDEGTPQKGGGDDGPSDEAMPAEPGQEAGEVHGQTNRGDDGPEPTPATEGGSAEGGSNAQDAPSATTTSDGPDPEKAKRWAADVHRFADTVFKEDGKVVQARKVDAVIFCATGGRTTSAKALAGQLEANNVQMLLRDVQRGDATVTDDTDGGTVTVARNGHTFVLAPNGDGLRIVEESHPADEQQRLVS